MKAGSNKKKKGMYFDKKLVKMMIKRENNSKHILVSKIFEAILLSEFKHKRGLIIADLGAGAHSIRYKKFIEHLKVNNGSLYWVDRSPLMLGYAQKNLPNKYKNTFKFVKEDMTLFLNKKKKGFDGLIFKYSFNYLIAYSLKKWLEIIYASLKPGGKVIFNQKFYEKEGMTDRGYNVIYQINRKRVRPGYHPKNGEIIELLFLKKAGDASSNPATFAKTKIIYYSPAQIASEAKKAGFSKIDIYNDWRDNIKWRKLFINLNPNIKSKQKTIVCLEK